MKSVRQLITVFWSEFFRQVRIEGDIYQVPEWESDKYFQSRPRESQISALSSGREEPIAYMTVSCTS